MASWLVRCDVLMHQHNLLPRGAAYNALILVGGCCPPL